MSRRRQGGTGPEAAKPTESLILEYERAHRELVAAEARANAATRWWLFVPIILLLVPIALSSLRL